MKRIIYTLTLVATVMLSSCTDDLDQMPITETTSASVYTTEANYQAVLGKLYASFVIAGQEKGGTNPDLSSNTGQDFMRCYFNMQEMGTDEVINTWIEGDKLKGLTYLNWDANDSWVADTYYRIYYTIALCNEFLRNATDAKIAKFTQTEQESIRHYRAEARFLRALSYYHALDFYRNVPFVDETTPVGAYIPPRYTSAQIFKYIEDELVAVDADLLANNEAEYGHATKAAAWTLLARLYLNAKVYINTDRYTDCITNCKKVIGAGYSLETDYSKLFNASNHLRTNEIIFPFIVDHANTMSWGSTTYLVCGSVSTTSEYQKAADYGVASPWGSMRMRSKIPALFEANDGRGMFFTEGQQINVDVIDDQSNGYLCGKWKNITDAGEVASNTGSDGVDNDFPMFRLADVYLMLAESVIKGGAGSSTSEALFYVNELRKRAYGSDTEGQVTATALTEDFILDERGRELYWEGVRRTDLIRHDKFTTDKYIWEWKGGVKAGQAVDSKYNYYPIPTSDLTANPNLYNENY